MTLFLRRVSAGKGVWVWVWWGGVLVSASHPNNEKSIWQYPWTRRWKLNLPYIVMKPDPWYCTPALPLHWLWPKFLSRAWNPPIQNPCQVFLFSCDWKHTSEVTICMACCIWKSYHYTNNNLLFDELPLRLICLVITLLMVVSFHDGNVWNIVGVRSLRPLKANLTNVVW